eukprot:2569484-Prymnesium_polylepis.1
MQYWIPLVSMRLPASWLALGCGASGIPPHVGCSYSSGRHQRCVRSTHGSARSGHSRGTGLTRCRILLCPGPLAGP